MKYPSFAALLLASLALVSVTRADESVQLRTQSGTVPASVRAIEAENSLGNVTVVAAADRFGWEWRLVSNGRPTAATEDYAEDCEFEVREVGGVLRLTLRRPDRQGEHRSASGVVKRFLNVVTLGVVSKNEPGVRSDLVLRVPATHRVGIKNSFGRVGVEGMQGEVKVDCRNGELDLKDLPGTVSASNSFGRLRAERIGTAQLTGQNGTLEVSAVSGDLRATNSFGKLQVRDVKGAAILKNQNGAIIARGIGGDVTAATSFGDLRIEEVGGKADVKNQNGRIELSGVTNTVKASTAFGTLKAHGLGSSADLRNQNGVIDAAKVTGDLQAETSFGDLRVEEVGGQAVLKARNGKIDAARVTGNLSATTSFAALQVREIGGAVELDGQNSEITASGIAGDIRATTSFGRMRLEGNGRRFTARTQNGAIEIVARSPGVQHIDARASFAGINVQLPADTQPLIRATASMGQVKSDFPVLLADTMSEASFAAHAAPLKVRLNGQNGNIRIEQVAAR
jgi:hypothetical protein